MKGIAGLSSNTWPVYEYIRHLNTQDSVDHEQRLQTGRFNRVAGTDKLIAIKLNEFGVAVNTYSQSKYSSEPVIRSIPKGVIGIFVLLHTLCTVQYFLY